MDFLLQITSKVFQFIELAHQLCLYNTPERLAVFFTFVPIPVSYTHLTLPTKA